jgi:hypothetical protein
VSTPRSLKPYTSAQLHDLKKKIDKWKEEREENEKESSNSSCSTGVCKMSYDNKGNKGNKEIKSSSNSSKFNLKQYRVAVGLEPDFGGQADEEALRGRKTGPRQHQAPKRVQYQTFDEMKNNIQIKNPDVWDIVKNSFEGVEKETGVPSQTGTESWDIRTTLSHLDKRGQVGLAALLSYVEDLEADNPNWGGHVWRGEGENSGDYFTRIGGETFRIPRASLKAFHDVINAIKERKLDNEPFDDDFDDFDDFGSEDSIEDLLGDYNPLKMSGNVDEKKVLSSTVKNLIRIAQDMDDSGNYKHAEEVHKVIRKYKDKLGGREC